MDISLQMEIKKRKKYYDYLRENSNWFKELNRNQYNFNNFNSFIKEKYRLKITDKLGDAMDNINMISSFLDIMK